MSFNGLFWLVGLLAVYCLIGFGFYEFCRLLAEKVMFFDLLGDIWGLDAESQNFGKVLWLVCWPVLMPPYLILSSVILLIACFCVVSMMIWVRIFPNHAPKGLASN